MLLLMLLGGCFVEKLPDLFDYRYDRLRVVAVRVWPIMADAGVPREVEALVLTPVPGGAPPVRVEVCGDRSDMVVWLASYESVRCFSEPDLVDVVAHELPAVWTPRPRAYDDCPPDGIGTPSGPYETFPDTGLGEVYPCVSVPLLRAVAGEGTDEVSVVAAPRVTDGEGPPIGAHPATADPRLEIVQGEPVPGGRVLLRFSVAAAWTEDEHNLTDPYPEHAWYVEAGTPFGSGVTRGAGFDDEGRAYAQNWLRIPDDHRGPLRVAAVRRDPVPVWAETTLEVR